MNYQVNIINNLGGPNQPVAMKVAEEIAELLKINYLSVNKDTYTEAEMHRLLSNKTAEDIYENASKGLLVYLTNLKQIIAVGMVVKKNDRYEAKTLNVSPSYKKQGLARKVCDLRENILREMGIKECFIESLKFPETINFHKSRGYEEVVCHKKLVFTVYMRKRLFP